MYYSRKKSVSASYFIGGIARAIFVFAVAIWFCSSTSLSPDTSSEECMPASAGAPPITAMTAEEENDSRLFINPTDGVLTSSFGMRDGRNHDGIDIGAESGTEIYAAAGGTVVFAGVVSGYGNYVVLEHADGYETAYAHCSKIAVNLGDEVSAGDVIAYVGSTGNSTGPHLHFEVKHSGELCDPLDYVVY